MAHYSTRRPRAATTVLAFTLLLGGAVLAATLPTVAATPTNGAWIFPTSHRTAAVADALDDSFYTGDNADAWLQDSFFADSQADSASVSVDLYNPTSADLYNIQLFVAYSVDDLDLVTSINFSGGELGDLSYSGTDLESGGTPQMAGGLAIDGHDVYPAYFVSYGVGDLPAGAADILTITIDIIGGFEGGLIVHLDYTAEDADEAGVSGPFEADMNIFENGESTDNCDATVVPLSLQVEYHNQTADSMVARVAFEDAITGIPDGVNLNARFSPGQTVKGATYGTFQGVEWSWSIPQVSAGDSYSAEVTVALSKLLIDGDAMTVDAEARWTNCDGSSGVNAASDSAETSTTAAGDAHSAAWWSEQAEKTKKGAKKAVFNTTQFELLLQRAALHSGVFTWGPWDGDAPTGDDDTGAVDIGALAKAMKVLDRKTDESKKVRGAEAQALALWLNVASGAVNLDSSLEIYERKHHCHGSHSEFGSHTGMNTLPSAYDTPAEILAFLEMQIKDWQDGQGASTNDLKLARRLAKAVNLEWLVLA